MTLNFSGLKIQKKARPDWVLSPRARGQAEVIVTNSKFVRIKFDTETPLRLKRRFLLV